jgi:hypothetical protein
MPRKRHSQAMAASEIAGPDDRSPSRPLDRFHHAQRDEPHPRGLRAVRSPHAPRCRRPMDRAPQEWQSSIPPARALSLLASARVRSTAAPCSHRMGCGRRDRPRQSSSPRRHAMRQYAIKHQAGLGAAARGPLWPVAFGPLRFPGIAGAKRPWAFGKMWLAPGSSRCGGASECCNVCANGQREDLPCRASSGRAHRGC